jgi:lysozyme
VRTTPEAIAMIKSFESLELSAYPDPGSPLGLALTAWKNTPMRRYQTYPDWKKLDGRPWTIGWGRAHGVSPGQTITVPQAEWYFEEDVEDAEASVERLVKVPLSGNEFSALVSFVFDLGPNHLEASTLLRKLNAGDRARAAVEFLRWNHSGKDVLPGLTERREAEMKLFLKPDPPPKKEGA